MLFHLRVERPPASAGGLLLCVMAQAGEGRPWRSLSPSRQASEAATEATVLDETL
jgi:hypothetical protein